MSGDATDQLKGTKIYKELQAEMLQASGSIIYKGKPVLVINKGITKTNYIQQKRNK